MTVRGEPRATRRSELHCRRNRQSIPRLRETRKRPDVPGTDEARVLVRRRENGRSRSDASRVTGYGKPQGESATGRWPRRVPFDVLTHSAATPRRERCASHAALSNHVSKHGEEASREAGRSRHDGRRPDRCTVAPQGTAGWRSRSRGSTRGVRRKTGVPPASPRFWNRRGGARDDDRGRQRSVTNEVKAAPADEARAVRHSKRREALALELLGRGLGGGAKAKLQSREPRTDRSKLAGANS
jgi:hypothetical protein